MYCTVHSNDIFRHWWHPINKLYPFGACHASDSCSIINSPPPCPPPFEPTPLPHPHLPQYQCWLFVPAHTRSWTPVAPCWSTIRFNINTSMFRHLRHGMHAINSNTMYCTPTFNTHDIVYCTVHKTNHFRESRHAINLLLKNIYLNLLILVVSPLVL